MSPIPYVRGQVVILAILIAGASLFDAAPLGLSCGAAAFGWLLLLKKKYGWDLSRTEAVVPTHRARLDRVVAGDTLFTLLPASLLAALIAADIVHPLNGHGAVHGAAAALAVAATVIWASSLFDWYLILPRISGQLGARPCRSASRDPRVLLSKHLEGGDPVVAHPPSRSCLRLPGWPFDGARRCDR